MEKNGGTKEELSIEFICTYFYLSLISSIPFEVGKVSNKSDCKILSDYIMN